MHAIGPEGPALALMEEFGLGNMEIIKALSPFPGIGGAGQTCGGLTGDLIALGLYFGSDDMLDFEAVDASINIAQTLWPVLETNSCINHALPRTSDI